MADEKYYISQIKLPGDERTYDIKDAEGRVLIQNLTDSRLSYTTKYTTLPVVVDDDVTPAAGQVNWKDIKNVVCLIKESESGTDVYGEWLSIRSGSGTTEDPYVYKWEKIGSTATDLNSYVKKSDDIKLRGNSGTARNTADTADIEFLYDVSKAEDTTDTVGSSTGKFTPVGTNADSNVTINANDDTFMKSITLTANTPTAIDTSKFNQGNTELTKNELPTLTTSVADEVLTISFTQGTQAELTYTAPSLEDGFYTAGTAASLNTPETASALTAITSATAAAQTFTGTEGDLTVSSDKAFITGVGAITGSKANHIHTNGGTARYND